MRLHMRSRRVAAITALWLVMCGVLAMRHEASTAHVVGRTGLFVHGKALIGAHTGHDSDVHSQRNPEADAGECAVLTASHQAACAEIAAPHTVAAAATIESQSAPRVALAPTATAVYRLAPKTSPPVAG